jgi:hypothetical protein
MWLAWNSQSNDREASWQRFILFIHLSKEIFIGLTVLPSVSQGYCGISWYFKEYNNLMKKEKTDYSFVTWKQNWNDTEQS